MYHFRQRISSLPFKTTGGYSCSVKVTETEEFMLIDDSNVSKPLKKNPLLLIKEKRGQINWLYWNTEAKSTG